MSNIVIDQAAILALVDSMKALHSRLDVFEKAQQAQQALNNQFRQEVNDLHSVISNLEKLVRSPTTVPADSSPIVNPAVFTTPAQPAQPQHLGPQPPQWTQILQRAAPANPKRRREHAIRVLHPPALPPIIPPMMLFIYTVLTVWLILNIVPLSLLLALTASAYSICVRTVRFIKLHTVPGVLKLFVAQNWISATKAQALAAELLPRPAKRTPTAHSNLGQLLLDPSIASHLRIPVLYDLFGNVVESDFMEVTEEFHPSAHSPDPDKSLQ
ncbi:hypothetical protein [Parasitella parasitica]|uniref:Uncharacterized protein n=1 Tax=Parasitella parasitica TaxID=35722 RepID=A0A0B7N6H7_9FUNG|nr:hypothetical protein [Parasitella parasitica]